MEQDFHKWTKNDKWRYGVSLIPFAILFIGSIIIMSPICIYMSILWVLIYLVVNIFQATCCIGCPYRGQYCPAIFGVYLSNYLSALLYRDEIFDLKLFKQNAIWAEISLITFLIYPVYWLYQANWHYVVAYFGLILLHILLFMPLQCRKCGYRHVCPGGRFMRSCCKLFGQKNRPVDSQNPAK